MIHGLMIQEDRGVLSFVYGEMQARFGLQAFQAMAWIKTCFDYPERIEIGRISYGGRDTSR